MLPPLSDDDIADVISLAIKAATAPLLARLELLEAKGAPAAIVGEKGKDGIDGKDAEPVDLDVLATKVLGLIPKSKDGTNGIDGAQGPAGKDAEVDLDALALKVLELVPTPKDGANGQDGKDGAAGRDAEVDLDAIALKAADLIPMPKDGVSVTADDLAPLVADLVEKAVAQIPPAKDGAPGPAGASVDPADVEAMVTKAVATLPLPKDGQSVTVQDVVPLVASEVEKAVKAIPVPKDGVGVAGALIDKDGLLVLTLSDGSMKELGLVVGRDGERGEAGVSGNPGANGTDGRDGTLEQLTVAFDGKRTLTLCFKDGTPVEGGVIKLVGLTRYEGVYSSEREYETGDQVTYGSSQWTAKAGSIGKQPGTNDGAPFWQLSTKRGEQGKPGPTGPKGEKGDKGLDLRQSDVRGVLR